MLFEALRARLPDPIVPGAPEAAWPRVGRGGVSFSDDLARPGGGRLGVRVRITDRDGGGYQVDLRDSDPVAPAERFRLGASRAHAACVLAFAHALGRAPTEGMAAALELLVDPDTWVGTDEGSVDPAALALGMARTADAVLGALANAWPGRVGAGSCSLGAIVELRDGDDVLLTEVLPGGEGGRPDRPGADAWPGLVLPSRWAKPLRPEGVTIDGQLREGSGGGGKHPGGCGIVRTYRAERPLLACAAFDRVHNPPHGIDRAGPPLGTEAWLALPDQPRQRIDPWSPVALPPGARLDIHTCGGAGWGFPGYGDIEWDPREWFGSSDAG